MTTRTTTSERLFRGERGDALLEFALVLIVFLIFFFGIIDFARALYAYHFVSNAAREGTRYAIVRGTACSAPSNPNFDCNATLPQVQAYVTGITPTGINPNNMVVKPTWPGIGPGTGGTGGCDTSNGYPNNPGCYVQVQVQYGFNFVFPFMPSGACTIQTSNQPISANICMSSTSEMVISQ
jgi:Flp pilus assembly protein TadG